MVEIYVPVLCAVSKYTLEMQRVLHLLCTGGGVIGRKLSV